MFSTWVTYYNSELAAGLVVTLEVLVVSSIVTAIWALVIAVLRVSPIAPLRWLAAAYIEILRGTPLVVQILIIFAYLPTIGIRFSPFNTSVIALSLNSASYMAEFYRAGFRSVPRGQIEAAMALSMTRLTIFRRVIAPYALRVILPALGTMSVLMLLATPFVFLAGLLDLMERAALIHGRTSDFSVYLEITIIYVVIGMLLTAGNHWLERRLQLP